MPDLSTCLENTIVSLQSGEAIYSGLPLFELRFSAVVFEAGLTANLLNTIRAKQMCLSLKECTFHQILKSQSLKMHLKAKAHVFSFLDVLQ